MKYCSKCGNQLLDQAIICEKCGSKVNKNFNWSKMLESNVLRLVTSLIISTSIFLFGIGALASIEFYYNGWDEYYNHLFYCISWIVFGIAVLGIFCTVILLFNCIKQKERKDDLFIIISRLYNLFLIWLYAFIYILY